MLRNTPRKLCPGNEEEEEEDWWMCMRVLCSRHMLVPCLITILPLPDPRCVCVVLCVIAVRAHI